jgi:hypothetical protein
MVCTDENSEQGFKSNGGDELKAVRGEIHYFQKECMHDPCLRCSLYCPYNNGERGDEVKKQDSE